jgi:hypothetical protein
MGYGISLALAFLVAATISFSLTDRPAPDQIAYGTADR